MKMPSYIHVIILQALWAVGEYLVLRPTYINSLAIYYVLLALLGAILCWVTSRWLQPKIKSWWYQQFAIGLVLRFVINVYVALTVASVGSGLMIFGAEINYTTMTFMAILGTMSRIPSIIAFAVGVFFVYSRDPKQS